MSCTCASCIRTRTNFFASTCVRNAADKKEDHPKKMPLSTAQLLRHAEHVGTRTSKLCQLIYQRQAETGNRRILGVLFLIKKYGAAAVEDACADALDMGVTERQLVRRYLR